MPRTSLSFNHSGYATTSYKESKISTGAVVIDDSEENIAFSVQKIRQTVNTPGFRNFRIGKGTPRDSLPMNPFYYTETSTSWPTGVHRWFYPDHDSQGIKSGLLNFTVNFFRRGPEAGKINDTDLASLAGSLRDLKGQKVNLGVVLGERKKTSALILNTASRVSNALIALKRGSISGAKNALGLDPSKGPKAIGGSLSSKWLALQYGWKPLLNDVHGAAETVAKHMNMPVRFSLTYSKQHTWVLKDSVSTWGEVPVERLENGKYARKYVYVFSYSNEVVKTLSEVGIVNPLSIAWELLPYSFVVDWFLKVGEFVDSLDASAGLTFEKGCTTTFLKSTVTYKVNATKQVYGGTSSVDGNAKQVFVEVERNILSGFPSLTMPRFGTLLTPERTANALALLFQHISRK